MERCHVGIFALAFLTLLLSMPSAFGQVAEDNPGVPVAAVNAQSAFELMDLITNGQSQAASLSQVIENNGLNQSLLDDFTDALDEAASLAAVGDLAGAEAALDDADVLLDDVYDKIYDEVDSQQSARYDHFVEDAIDSLTFIIENNNILGISPKVIEELEITLAILENGDYDEVIAATGENSGLGLTALMFPNNFPGFGNASPQGQESAAENSEGKARGIGLGNVDNLPPGIDNLPTKIKERYGYYTDSDLTSQNNDDDAGVTNDVALPPGFGAALRSGEGPSEQGLLNGKGLGLGNRENLPPGIEKLLEVDFFLDKGFSPDNQFSEEFEYDEVDSLIDQELKPEKIAEQELKEALKADEQQTKEDSKADTKQDEEDAKEAAKCKEKGTC